MSQSKIRRRKGHGEVMPPLSKLERIDALLEIQRETFPQKELSRAEIERWEMDLSDYPIRAIEFAFEEHRTLAMFFPVPAQILDICKTWEAPQAYKPGCNPECKERHGKGYSENDVLCLWNLYQTKSQAVSGRPLNEIEVSCLFDALDKKRGYAPEWRRSA